MGGLTFTAGPIIVEAHWTNRTQWLIEVDRILGPPDLRDAFVRDLDQARGIGHTTLARHCFAGLRGVIQDFAEEHLLPWSAPPEPGPVPQPPVGSVW